MAYNSNSSNALVENDGVHLHRLIQTTGCKKHNVPTGTACYTLPNNVNPQTDYVAACGARIKQHGFNGRVSAQSMRTEAPRKSGPGAKRTFSKKKPNANQTSPRGKK